MSIDPNSFVGLSGVPLLVALVEGIKTTFPRLESRWWPWLSIGVGVAFNVALAGLLGTSLGLGALVGLVAVSSASGLYSWLRRGQSV